MSRAPRPDDWRFGLRKTIIIGIAVDEDTPISIPIPIAIPTPSIYGWAFSQHGIVLTETRFIKTEHIFGNCFRRGQGKGQGAYRIRL